MSASCVGRIDLGLSHATERSARDHGEGRGRWAHRRQRRPPARDRRRRSGRAWRRGVPAIGALPDQPHGLPALRRACVRGRRHSPVILLADNAPGYGQGVAAMISFTGEDQYRVGEVPVPPPTSVPANPNIYDATSSTFYSALSNVDFEIGKAIPAPSRCVSASPSTASCVISTFISDRAWPASTRPATSAMDLRFFGGRYGILTEKTSPAWQFTLIDSEFEGQRDAAIREHEVGPHPDQHRDPQRARRDRDRPRLFGFAVGQGCPLRECLAPAS
jgi:hypothetical protein